MYILAIETTGKYAGVALYDLEKKEIAGYRKSGEERSHLKGLIPMVDELLKEKGVKKSELQFVASSVGPGSFTGIRIGVATARAISQSLGIKLISVPTLDAFLKKEEALKAIEEGKTVAVIINARRMQVYGLVYRNMEMVVPAGPYMLDDIINAVKEDSSVYFFGDGIDAYEKYLGSPAFQFAEDRYQDPCSVSLLAYEKMEDAKMYSEVLPEYMRITEAEAKLKSGELKITKMRQD